jgi:hypothetical protein
VARSYGGVGKAEKLKSRKAEIGEGIFGRECSSPPGADEDGK